MMSWWGEGSLYTVFRDRDKFVLVKFDDWFNPLKWYSVKRLRNRWMHCECPEKDQPMCKHRRILLLFEQKMRVGKGWFYDWDDHSWEPPLTWPISQQNWRVRLRYW